jgi:hypothetical protein
MPNFSIYHLSGFDGTPMQSFNEEHFTHGDKADIFGSSKAACRFVTQSIVILKFIIQKNGKRALRIPAFRVMWNNGDPRVKDFELEDGNLRRLEAHFNTESASQPVDSSDDGRYDSIPSRGDCKGNHNGALCIINEVDGKCMTQEYKSPSVR